MKEGKLVYFKSPDAAVKSTFIFDLLYYVFVIISGWICYAVYTGFSIGTVPNSISNVLDRTHRLL